jgi:CBS domain-containing protein
MATQYVREVMARSLVTSEPDDSVVSALQLMRTRGTHSVLFRLTEVA